jgi:hypothetical protein
MSGNKHYMNSIRISHMIQKLEPALTKELSVCEVGATFPSKLFYPLFSYSLDIETVVKYLFHENKLYTHMQS